MSTNEVLTYVTAERERQERLKASGKFAATCADPMPLTEKLAVLAEEFGEVARAVCDGLGSGRETDHGALIDELVQVAAVAVAWLEAEL
jgi:NTP pyrophosphatase (non-canonical NTP hydrolase)